MTASTRSDRPGRGQAARRLGRVWLRLGRSVLLGAAALGLFGCPKLPNAADEMEASEEEEEDPAPLDSERRLDQLGRSELQSLCQDLNQELSTRFDNRRLVTYACTRMYIQRGDTLSCNLNVNDCLSQNTDVSVAAPRAPDFQIDNAECAAIGACRVSVGVFDTCIGDRFDQSEQLLARITCNLANDPEAVDAALRQADSPRAVPQSCAAVAASCPGLL